MVEVVWTDKDMLRRELDGELERLVTILHHLPGIVEAWVFGSLSAGRVHAGSDVDILVVRDTDETPVERGLTLRDELTPETPCDLFVYTPAEWAAGSRFTDEVRRQGRRLL